MELIHSAPAVRSRRKTRWNPSAVDESIRQALFSARGNPSPMVVLHDGDAIGVVRGDADCRHADYVPLRHGLWCTVSGYTDLRTAFSQRHGTRAYFRQEIPNWTLNDCWMDCWPAVGTGKNGINGGTYTGTANTARQLDNTSPGALWWSVKPGGSETMYLMGWTLSNTGGGLSRQIILYDRVVTYESVSISNVVTNFTNTLAAQRYVSAGDPGLCVTPTCQTATGATASNITGLTFTDDSGNAGVAQATSFVQAVIASSLAPSNTAGAEVVAPSSASRTAVPWLNLGGTVQGARKLESLTCSAANTGTLCLVLHKPIATMWLNGSSVNNFLDLTKSMYTLTKVFSTACLSMLLYQSNSNGGAFQGEISFGFK